MTFPSLCLTPEHWMGSRVQTKDLFSLVVGGAGACGVTKAIYKELCFPTWASAAGFNNNNKNRL